MEKNYVGQRFGKLLLIERLPRYRYGQTHYKCRCDCGNEKIICSSHLVTGLTKSCGCLFKEKTGREWKTHNLSNSKLYQIWTNIKNRTTRSNSKLHRYSNYDRLDIKMCDEWKNDFMSFYNWAINNGYKEEKLPNGRNKLTIDRINPYGDYTPDNCRWITIQEQLNNMTTNRLFTINNKTLNLSQWCKEYGKSPSLVKARLKYGWDIEKALTKDINEKYRKNK